MNPEIIPPSNLLECQGLNCTKIFKAEKKYSIYDKDFCSRQCLKKFKCEYDKNKQVREPFATINIHDYGGNIC